MINQTADIIHYKDTLPDSNHKAGKKKTNSKSSPESGKKTVGNTGRRNTESPSLARRILPNAPSILKINTNHRTVSKSTDELNTYDVNKNTNKEIMDKYKYNSLPRKKNDRSNSSVSTFYINENDDEKFFKANNSTTGSPKHKRKDSVDKINFFLKRNDSKCHGDLTTHDRQTHVALYKFQARHKDELSFSNGDPIQALKIHDDLWYEGINLLNGKQGVFPCRYVADILTQDNIYNASLPDIDHQQFHMRFLGSVEVADYKGDEIICFAIAKVVNQRSMLTASDPPPCILQVHSKGVRILDIELCISNDIKQDKERKGKKIKSTGTLTNDDNGIHYFLLKNVTFCGNHPKDRRYFAFITKHPDEHRFACHIFMSKYSTDKVAKCIGDAFKNFYDTYIECAASTEGIYIE